MNGRPSVKRFPRLIRGETAGVLITLLWQKPEFSVVFTKEKEGIEFRFRVPVPDDLRLSYPPVWELFFGGGKENWKEALSDSYRHARWGDKYLSHSISNHLRVVYKDALRIWLKASLALTQDEGKKANQLQAFQRNSQIKRSQPDPWLALWVALRFEALQSSIKELRIRVKSGPNMSNASLIREIEAHVPSVPSERALGRLFGGKKDCNTRALFARVSVREIAEAYILCEIEDRHSNLGIHPLRTYIRLGDKIRETLSELTFS